MNAIHASTGIPQEVLRFGITLLSGFPLAYIYNKLPHSPMLKHLYSIVTTSILFLLVFTPDALLHLLGAGMYTFVITMLFGSSKYSPIVCFVLLMSHMSYIHVVAQIVRVDDPDFIDASSTMMVLVMKLSSFAWSVYDASLPVDKLSQDQKDYAVRQHPSIVAFMGYCLFFCGVWVGPAFEYQTYHQFVHQQALSCFVGSVFFMGLQAWLTPTVHFIHCSSDTFRYKFTFFQR